MEQMYYTPREVADRLRLHEATDDDCQRSRDIRGGFIKRLALRAAHFGQNFSRCRGIEWPRAGKNMIESTAQAEQIGPFIEALAACLFGRHIPRHPFNTAIGLHELRQIT